MRVALPCPRGRDRLTPPSPVRSDSETPSPIHCLAHYTYNANGSRLSEVQGANRTTYTWDARNRLDHTEYPSNVRLTNVYDYEGLRRKQTGAGGVVTLTHWDQQIPFLQTDGSGTSKNETTHVPSQWGHPVAARVSGASYYPTFDELSSLRGELDTNVNRIATASYDAYGEDVSATGLNTQMGFVGELGYQRDASGRYYVRDRHYDAYTGQWLSVDPVTGEPRYSYAHNMPTAGVDPSGRQFALSGFIALKEAQVFSAPIYDQHGRLLPVDDAGVKEIVRAGRVEGSRGSAGYQLGINSNGLATLHAIQRTPSESKKMLAANIRQAQADFRRFQADPTVHAAELFVAAERAVEAGVEFVGEQLSSAIKSLLRAMGMESVPGLLTELLRLGWSTAVSVINSFREIKDALVSSWERLRHSLPGFLANVAPPSPLQPIEFAKYVGGFFLGILKGLISLIPFSWLKDVWDFIRYLIEHGKDGGLWNNTKKYISQIFTGFADFFTKDLDLSSYARGSMAGSMLVALVMLILAIVLAATGIGAAFAAGGVRGVLKSIGAGIKAEVSDLAASVKAAPGKVIELAKKVPVSVEKVVAGTKANLTSISRLRRAVQGASTRAKSWLVVEVRGRRVYQRDDLFDPLAVDSNGLSNLERMRKGRSPIGYDGEPVNLHHLIQQEPGAMAEVAGGFHSEYHSELHGLVEPGQSFRYSETGKTTAAELAFERWKYGYWQERARGLK